MGFLFVVAAALFALACVPAKIAGDKGHSFFGYFVFGLLFFLPALVVALIVNPVVVEERTARMGCPQCGESIAVSGSLCRFCGLDLSRVERPMPAWDAHDGRNGVQVGPRFPTTESMHRWLEHRGPLQRTVADLEDLLNRTGLVSSDVSPEFMTALAESNWTTAARGTDLEGSIDWLVAAVGHDLEPFSQAADHAEGKPSSRNPPDEDMAYMCETCDRIIDDRESFAMHLRNTHGYSSREAGQAIEVAETYAE
ncbi:MAG: hypothetical protein JWM47_1954 [Acidimicrobiales bacterium]|nr:hypothetical protein [Acidimicrobiales bacterium]